MPPGCLLERVRAAGGGVAVHPLFLQTLPTYIAKAGRPFDMLKAGSRDSRRDGGATATARFAPAAQLCFHPSAMPPITAILHTCNDAHQIGRALESLRPCDEILVLDHDSTDTTIHAARQFAATVRLANRQDSPSSYMASARYDWVLCLLPSESLTESLEASLYEWKIASASQVAVIPSCSAVIREETSHGWIETPASTRLVPKHWTQWEGNLPRHDPRSRLLQGELLRFRNSI